jgi:putative redox protein
MTHAHAHIEEPKYATLIDVSGFSLRADEPMSLGGGNTGPAPYDLLAASLTACTAITLRMYAEHKQWPLTALEIDVRLVKADGGDRIERTLAIVGLDEQQRARLAEVAERTPVTLTLKAGIPIQTMLT